MNTLAVKDRRILVCRNRLATECCGPGGVCECLAPFPVFAWNCATDPVSTRQIGDERRFGAVRYELTELIQVQAVNDFAQGGGGVDSTVHAEERLFFSMRAVVCINADGAFILPGSTARYDYLRVSVVDGESSSFERHLSWSPDDWRPRYNAFDYANAGPIFGGSIETTADSVNSGSSELTVGVSLPGPRCNATRNVADAYDRSVGGTVDRGSIVFDGQASVNDADGGGSAFAYHTYSESKDYRSGPILEITTRYAQSVHVATWARDLRCPSIPPSPGFNPPRGCVGCGGGGL